jgi:hypothetical protein
MASLTGPSTLFSFSLGNQAPAGAVVPTLSWDIQLFRSIMGYGQLALNISVPVLVLLTGFAGAFFMLRL